MVRHFDNTFFKLFSIHDCKKFNLWNNIEVDRILIMNTIM